MRGWQLCTCLYAAATGGGEIPFYETIRGPTTNSHVTANIMTQHYEIQGPVHYDVLEVNGPATECGSSPQSCSIMPSPTSSQISH